MNPLVVLTTVFAAAFAAPSNYAAVAPLAHPVAPLAHPVAYQAAAPAISVPAPYSTEHIAGPDTVHHSQAPAVVTKTLQYGSKDFVSGHIAQIHKPAIPDFPIQAPTALKGSVSYNAPLVKTQKEVHVVNEPVPVVKEVRVPYDVPVYKEQVIEVPTPVHKVKPVPVEVPYAVPGKEIVNIKHTAPVVQHTHSHHVAAPAVAAYAHHQPAAAVYAHHQPAVAAYAHQPAVAAYAQPALAYAQPAIVAKAE